MAEEYLPNYQMISVNLAYDTQKFTQCREQSSVPILDIDELDLSGIEARLREQNKAKVGF